MANVAYELAMRVGTAAHRFSRRRQIAGDPAESALSQERRTPLEPLGLPEGRAVYWLHAVSAGEVGVAAVLVGEIKRQCPEAIAVVSTATATGLGAAKSKIPSADAVVVARYDVRGLIASMFDAIRPTALILVEGDLWRNILAVARRRGVPVFVANAKLSQASHAGYRKVPIYTHAMLSRLAHVYVQSQVYEQRFLELGLDAEKCEVSGNIKLDAAVEPPTPAELTQLAHRVGCEGAFPIVTFGSLHPGEELAALEAMEAIWRLHPTAHGIIVPRHIDRTAQIAESILAAFGQRCHIYSKAEADDQSEVTSINDLTGQPSATSLTPSSDRSAPLPLGTDRREGLGVSSSPTRVTIVDKMGLLMKLYALCDIAVVGGTFVRHVGGHNLAEPAFVSKPVVYGPYVQKQPGLHDLIAAYDAGVQATAEAFPALMLDLAQDRERIARLGNNGAAMIAASRGVASRIVTDILARAKICN